MDELISYALRKIDGFEVRTAIREKYDELTHERENQ